MQTRFNFVSFIIVMLSLFSLISCGKKINDEEKNISDQFEVQEDDEGVYRALLKPLNKNVISDISGAVEISVEGDNFSILSQVSHLSPGIKHYQNVITSDKCPNDSFDENKDSFIDSSEILKGDVGILIPLDMDISSQLEGSEYGPIANNHGSFSYRRSASLSHLLSDLKDRDPDPSDLFLKLPHDINLNLSKKIVIIHGLSEKTQLPYSVKSPNQKNVHEMFPVACGELIRVTKE